MNAPLAGIRVVSIEQAVAAPICTRHLLDLGAEVIKVEPPAKGDFSRRYDRIFGDQSTHFVWLNHGKRSVAVNFHTAAGRGVVERLIASADVFVCNLSARAAERAFPYEQVQALNPSIVAAYITGYGQDGPYRDRRAYDLLVQAEAGAIASTGTPGHYAKMGVSVADLATGVYALAIINAALVRRRTTGEGDRITVNLFDSLVEWMMPLLLEQRATGQSPVPVGTRHATLVPYGPFAAGDDVELVIGIQTEEQWVRLCRDVIGDPELADDVVLQSNSGRLARREYVESRVAAGTARLASAQLIERLDEYGIPWSHLRSLAEVVEHPQIVARGRWHPVLLPDGATTDVLAPPFSLDGMTVADEMRRVPALGEHTGAVLFELGYSESEVAELDQAGVLSLPASSARPA